ncbi:cytochrome c oxidase subunit II [Planctomicrobium sp. SH664]|uniref:cytochrome c oxidase subunit II n=1 Tax=Planctomicrobium sp. SH664 TaxID=3448125 RepID=UPI003F5C6C6B
MDKRQFQFFPEQASTFAKDVDVLYGFQVAVTIFFTLLICALILGFGIYYRRGSKAKRGNQSTSTLMELMWASVPLVLSMTMFAWGAVIFYQEQVPPPNTLDIEVVGKQWMWKAQHPGGMSEINSLHVPAGQPIRLRMVSEDVIHSFFVPAFRVKQDVLPGYYTQMWFQATKPGDYHLFCAEYCGTDHSLMKGTVTVMEPTEYARWLSGSTNDPPAVAGQKLFERYRCNTCHKSEGGGNGPSLVGLYGRVEPLAGGKTIVANEQYLRDSILNPQKHIVAGFQPLMPSFQGQINESEVLALIAYMKTLKTAEADAPVNATPDAKE